MLKPELARKQLEELRSKRHSEGRLTRIRQLPKAQSAVGMGIFGRDPEGNYPKDWAERYRIKSAAFAKLTADDKGRAKVFAGLFPTFHKEVELGWGVMTRLPYTAGTGRRSFRVGGRPGLYQSARQSFLEALIEAVDELPDDTLTAEWLAQWAVHLGWQGHRLGYLFAGVIDAGGPTADAVFEILKDSAANRHEMGGPGGHATRALLSCTRPEAWEFMVNLLLAAQRQEGLRQTILEAVDEFHPDAFRRMIRVILEENLIRFAAVARAAGVWLGEVHMVEDARRLKETLLTVADLLDSPAGCEQAVRQGDVATAYRGLWAIAFRDSEQALETAAPLFKDPDPGRRFAAAKLAIETGLPEAAPLMLPLLNDPDQRLLSLGLGYAAQLAQPGAADSSDGDEPPAAVAPKNLFERLEKLIPVLPEKPKELTAPVEGWYVPPLSQVTAANALFSCLGDRKAERLLPYLPMMSDHHRIMALAKLCEPRVLTTKVRQTLLAVAGETNRYVREAALKYIKKCTLAEDEVQTLEGYLTRKTADFRRSLFEVLLSRPDRPVLGTIDRLLDTADANSRAAGIEIARRMVDNDRDAEVVRERLRKYRDKKGKRLAPSEARAIEIILDPALRPPTLDDGLGLFNPAERSPVVDPEPRSVQFATPAAVAFIQELDEFIHQNRDKT